MTLNSVPPPIPSPSHKVSGTLFYSLPSPTTSSDEPWWLGVNDRKCNFINTPITTTIYDIRGQEHFTHIDSTGFQALTYPSSVPGDFILNSPDEEIAKTYYPECEALLKKYTGASRVVFFDHTIRKRQPEGTIPSPQTREPVLRVHSDQTPISAHRRVDRHVQPPLPYKRFQIINVWRPLVNTVYDYPLAVCDFNSLDVDVDLEPTALLYPPPTVNGETYSLRPSPRHAWWYWSEMTVDNVMLLKCYDSASRALSKVKRSRVDVQETELREVAGMAPHTAFLDEEGAKKGIPRSSIEVRCLVFYD